MKLSSVFEQMNESSFQTRRAVRAGATESSIVSCAFGCLKTKPGVSIPAAGAAMPGTFGRFMGNVAAADAYGVNRGWTQKPMRWRGTALPLSNFVGLLGEASISDPLEIAPMRKQSGAIRPTLDSAQ